MARRQVTPRLVLEWTDLRYAGWTIEEVALEYGVSLQTVSRYTPRGINSDSGKRQKRPRANARAIADTTYLEPRGTVGENAYAGKRHLH